MRRCLLLASALVVAACGSSASAPAPPKPKLDTSAVDGKRWTDFLARYLAIDTQNPPGNEAAAFPLLTEALASLSLTATVTPIGEGRGNLMARLVAPSPDPGAGPLILLHHVDVVPVEKEGWTVPPFEAVRKDGHLYGRGALDMKQVAAIHLAALERLVKQRARLRRDVVFLAVSDEEGTGLGARTFVEKELDRMKPQYLLDEGGFAIRGFMNDRDVVVIATAQKRPAKIRVVAHGKPGHGSRPIPDGGSAVLIEALERILAHPPPVRLIPTNLAMFERFGDMAGFPKRALLSRLDWPGVLWAMEGTLTRNKNLNPMLRDTVALTMVHAGQKDNVIPAEGTATLDVRLLPDTRIEDLIAALARTTEGLPVTYEIAQPPPGAAEESPVDDPLYRSLEETMRAHAPQATVAPWLFVAASDSRFFAPRGVKTYGFVPVFMDKPQIDTIHGHDERVGEVELVRGMVVYAEALEAFLLRPGS